MSYPLVPISDFATLALRPIQLQPNQEYVGIGVKWYGGGVSEHERRLGAEFNAERFLVRAGDLIYNDMWARKGSVAIVPPSFDGAVGSFHFPTFEVDQARADLRYLALYTKVPRFWEDCDGISRGSTGRNQIRVSTFLSLRVPLPDLDEQQRIVARFDALAAKLQEAGRLGASGVNDAASLADAIAGQIFADDAGSVDLGSIVDIIDPNPTHRYPAYVDDGLPLISTVNFDGPDGIDITNAPRVPDWFFEQTVERLGVTGGDVIFARKGRIGCARAYPQGQRLAMTHTLCVIRPDRARLHPAYLLQYLRSPFLLRFLQATMNPNSGVPTLGLNVIRRAPIQLPSLHEQEVIAARIGAATQQIAAVIESMKAAQDERHRLESALVSAAFSGRL